MTVTSSTGESDPLDEVSDALELTVAVLEDAIGDLKASTKAAVQDERFDVVASDNERLRDLRSFAGEVAELLARWEAHNGHDAAVTPGRDTAEPTDACSLRICSTSDNTFRFLQYSCDIKDRGGSVHCCDRFRRRPVDPGCCP